MNAWLHRSGASAPAVTFTTRVRLTGCFLSMCSRPKLARVLDSVAGQDDLEAALTNVLAVGLMTVGAAVVPVSLRAAYRLLRVRD